MCFARIWEQTAIISLYNINLLVFSNQDGVCLLRGTDCVFMYNSGQYTTLHSDCWAQKLYWDVLKLYDLAKY